MTENIVLMPLYHAVQGESKRRVIKSCLKPFFASKTNFQWNSSCLLVLWVLSPGRRKRKLRSSGGKFCERASENFLWKNFAELSTRRSGWRPYKRRGFKFIRGRLLFTDIRLIFSSMSWMTETRKAFFFLQPARYCFFHLKLRICYKLTRHSSLVRFSLKRIQTRWHLSWNNPRGLVAAAKIC